MKQPGWDLRSLQATDRRELEAHWSDYLRETGQHDAGVDVTMELQDAWWTKPEDLHGLAVLVGDQLAGFLFVMGPRYTEAIGESTDYHLYEAYVAPEARGTGIAEWAVQGAFQDRPGTWSLHASRGNERAVRFWRRVLKRLPHGVREKELDGHKLSFHFRIP